MKRVTIRAAVLLTAAWLAGCGQAAAGCGTASAYTPETAERGEHHNHMGVAAASQTLPLGTRVIVRNQRKGRSIVVTIAERSPSLLGRIIDLSADAMSALGMDAISPVCVEVLSYGSTHSGFGKITVRNPMAAVKHAAVPQEKHASSAARAAHVRILAKSARVGSLAKLARFHSVKGKHAQVHRHEPVRKSSRRHLAAKS